jgi:TetR/AcrR family transcriptional regulator, regulator of cefoperazone and chloramphenicol sensitivity
MASPVASQRSLRTRERLIEAAGRVFASRGYRGATMRDIADRAGVNLAAAHYHFGSKQDLYREVLREHFERLEARLVVDEGGAVDERLAGRPTRAALVELLRVRIRALLDTLLGSDDVHSTLVMREMVDPSEALPFLVRRWIDPLRRDTERIVSALAPRLDAEAVERATRSIVGQVFFYRSHRAALLLMMRRTAYPRGFVDAASDHVVAFTLGGLAELELYSSRGVARTRRARRMR